PEPVPLLSLHPLRRPLFKAELRRDKATIAGVDGLQFFRRHLDRAADFRELEQERAIFALVQQDGGAAGVQQPNRWEQSVRDDLQLSPQDAGAELGPGGCTLQQRWREAVVFQWQAIAQCLCGIGRAMNAG